MKVSDVAIRVEHLSKHYRLGQIGGGTLREDLDAWWQRLRGRRRTLDDYDERQGSVRGNHWALQDVSFDLKHGEVLGIIGANGAGKSTLLKILSRTTAPTRGSARINGRVGSLLEVGTGFHPELTGRENIFLNGSILGMRRIEISRKLEEIIAFSGVGKFIDTPVKRYSSGMSVRLAFSVAAHLEPEILIVDEVLAVGDAEFQKKCLGKMKDVSSHGRTILFVSHNLAAVRQLCTRGILLRSGKVEFDGASSDAADLYLRSASGLLDESFGEITFASDEKKAFQVTSVSMRNMSNERTTRFDCDEQVVCRIECLSRSAVPGLYGYLAIKGRDDQCVWESDSLDVPPNRLDGLTTGAYVLNLVVPPRTLAPGEYVVYLSFASSQSFSGFLVDTPGNTTSFSLTDGRTNRGDRRSGFFGALLDWNISPRASADVNQNVEVQADEI